MLAGALTAAILALACFIYGFFDGMDIGKLIAWHLAAGASGIAACTLFLVWVIQKI